MSRRLNVLIDGYIKESPDAKCFWWDGKWYNQSVLANTANSCEEVLRSAGFSEGQRIAVLMQNSPMFLALALAIWRIGGSICPLNVKSGVPSVLSTLALLEPFAVVLSDEIRQDLAPSLEEHDLPYVVSPLMGALPPFNGRKMSAEQTDLAVIFSTSGTTGTPKAVPLTHENIISNCDDSMQGLKALQPGDVFLNVLPNFHSFGFTTATILPIILKASQAIVPSFMPPKNTLIAIEQAAANVIVLVPMMLSYLLGLIERGMPRPKGIKVIITGGDKYNTNIDPKVESLMGVGVLEGYGITECSPVMSINASYSKRKMGTVGEFLNSFKYQLRQENGKLSEKNEGVLWVKGASVATGYFRVEETNKDRFDDGWFNTGDYVVIEDGYIRILDRVTDIVIVGGFNVYPQEVEAILQTHPAVQSAVVVGVPHPSSGEILKAYIQKKPDIQVSDIDIVRYCKDQLAHYKVPRKVEFVDSLPLSGTGKVLRRVLRDKEREKAHEKEHDHENEN